VNATTATHKHWRQLSKAPTFLLTYGGTFHGLMNNCGFDMPTAKAIEKSYHELYVESDQYVESRLQQAAIEGYVDCAFGLRVRTPLLARTILNNSKTPYEAAAESRTAGNALGQSWCQLNNRAAIAFMERVWASEYRYDILPIAAIHDANYFLVRNKVEVVKYVNDHYIHEMFWQDNPEIAHDSVHLGGELDVCLDSWASPVTIPNHASSETIKDICLSGIEKMLAEGK
jgi:DNA polymerase-1